MLDILLSGDGDVALTENGDISLTNSVRQAVLVRLRWLFSEWRLGPEFGFPWFEEVFVKNPNTVLIRSRIRDTILEVTGVTNATIDRFVVDRPKRTLSVRYTVYVGEETFREEMSIHA